MRTFLQWLRLFRLPLAFTAVGDAWAVRMVGDDLPAGWSLPPVSQLAVLAGISLGLFGLGMVLNDVIDAPADAARAPDKPIPSGSVSRHAAAVVAAALGVAALLLGAAYDRLFVYRLAEGTIAPAALFVAAVTAIMIVAYNARAKRLPVAGLLLLGLIRATHCQVSTAPSALGGWLTAFLFSHVTLLSLIAYQWEGKQPTVSTAGRWTIAFLVVILSGAGVSFLGGPGADFGPMAPRLIGPIAAALVFIAVLFHVARSPKYATTLDRGRSAMRLGLAWLLVYDAAFVASAGRWSSALLIAGLLLLLLLTRRALTHCNKVTHNAQLSNAHR